MPDTLDFVPEEPAQAEGIDFVEEKPEFQSGLVGPRERRFSMYDVPALAEKLSESPLPTYGMDVPTVSIPVALAKTVAGLGRGVVSPLGAAATAVAPIEAAGPALRAGFGALGTKGLADITAQQIITPEARPKTIPQAVELAGQVLPQLAMAAAPFIPEVTAAAYKNPKTGEVTAGAFHKEAAAEQGVKAPEAKEARETPDYGFIVQDPKTGATEFKTRPETEPIAQASGQLVQEPERPGQPHSDDIAAPGTDTPIAETKVPEKVRQEPLSPESQAEEQARLASELGEEEVSPEPTKALKALREEGVTEQNAKAILSGTKTPDQVVNEQLGVKVKYGSPDSPHLIIDENPDGSRTATVTPDAGPARMTPKNIGQNPHDVALRMAIDQGVERINAVLEEHGLIPKRPSAEQEFTRIQQQQEELEAKRLGVPVVRGEPKPTTLTDEQLWQKAQRKEKLTPEEQSRLDEIEARGEDMGEAETTALQAEADAFKQVPPAVSPGEAQPEVPSAGKAEGGVSAPPTAPATAEPTPEGQVTQGGELGEPADKFGAVFGPNVGKLGYEKLRDADFESQYLPSTDPNVTHTLQLKGNKLWLTTERKGIGNLREQAITYLHVKPNGETVLSGSFAHPNHPYQDLAQLGSNKLAEFVSEWMKGSGSPEKPAVVSTAALPATPTLTPSESTRLKSLTEQPVVRDMWMKLTRTPAVKGWIRDIEDNLSFIADLPVDKAREEIAKAKSTWSGELESLRRVESGKAEPTEKQMQDLRYWEGRQGKVIDPTTWAVNYGIPQAERMLSSFDRAKNALNKLIQRSKPKTTAVEEESLAISPAESSRLQALTEKMESGKPLTSAEQKRYRALKDKVSPPEGEKGEVTAGTEATEIKALRKADVKADPRLEMPGITKKSKPNSLIVALRDLDSVPVRELVLKSTGDPIQDAKVAAAAIRRESGSGRISLRESLAISTGPNGRAIYKFDTHPSGNMTWAKAQDWIDLVEIRKPPTTPPSTGEGMVGPGARTVGEPPYRAIQQLTDQLEATPPGPAKERIPMRERLADAWGQGKTAWEKALGKMTAAKQTLKDTARGVRTPKDMDRRVGELDWSLQQSAAQSLQAGKALEKQMPNKAMREAVAIWVDAGGDENLIRNVLANLPEGTPKNVRRALEVASNLPPESRALAEQTRQFYGIRAQDGMSADVLHSVLDDYFTHTWKTEKNMPDDVRTAFSNGRLDTFFRNALERKIPMFLNGILQGKVPELDPVSVIPNYNYSMDRAIASRKFIKEISDMTEADGRPTLSPVGRQTKVGEPGAPPDEGALLIKPKARWEENGDYHYVDHPALRKWKWAGTDENGRTILYQSDLVVHPDAYERISRMMDRGRLSPSKLTAAALRLSTEVKGFKLGVLSAFHTVHVGSHALFHWTIPFKMPKAFGEYGIKPIDWEAPDTRFAVEKGHLKLAPNPSELQHFAEGLLSPGLVHKIPLIGAWSKQFSEWNFGTYIPRLKMATFDNGFARAKFMRDKMGFYKTEQTQEAQTATGRTTTTTKVPMSDEQLAARIGDSVNSAFGELNQLFLGKNGRAPEFQRLLRGIFLAPDFGEARLRFAEKAFTRYGHEERIALATMFGVFYTTARVANLVSTGDPQWEPKRAFQVKIGNHWWSMRSVIGDAWRAVSDFGKFLYPRLNPVYTRPIMDLIVGRDVMSGKKLTTFDKLVTRPIEQIVPIHLGGLTRDDQKVWESFAGSMGLAAIRDTPEMDMKRMAAKWLSDNGHPPTAEYLPTDTPTYAKLRQALAIGNDRNARKIIAALKQTHEDKKIMDAMERYVNHPFTGSNEHEDEFVGQMSEPNLKLYQRAKEQRQKTLEDFYKIWFSIPKAKE